MTYDFLRFDLDVQTNSQSANPSTTYIPNFSIMSMSSIKIDFKSWTG
jgi:hypothetical protein